MLFGVTFQNRVFFPKKTSHQTLLKYKKELFDQVKKLKTNFFGVPNTHLILMLSLGGEHWMEKREKGRLCHNISLV